MYRKHLKMARGEGETGIRSHFVERVVKLPMVHVAWDYAANTYSHIKESNKLVNFTLTNAEKSVNFVAGQAKPVVMKFEKQIQAVDNLACRGLGTLEEKVPFITKPADEIITDTRKLYTSTVYSRLEGLRKYGTNKVKSVSDYSLEKANAILGKEVVDSLLNSVDGALVITESVIDRFLPPTADEKKKNDSENEKSNSALSRLVNIPNKIAHRSYRSLVLRFEYVQERGIELLLYPIGMIETSKVYMENVLKYVVQVWESFDNQKSDTEDGEKSTALSTVRDRALWVIGLIRIVPSLLPMYIYGFASWLETKRGKKSEDSHEVPEEVKQNGDVKQSNSSHNCENSKSHEPNCHTSHQGANDAS